MFKTYKVSFGMLPYLLTEDQYARWLATETLPMGDQIQAKKRLLIEWGMLPTPRRTQSKKKKGDANTRPTNTQ